MTIKKIIWTLPFLTFLIGYCLTNYFFAINEVETPTVIGKPLNEASKILSDQNLNIRILNQKEDPDLPDGTVLDQTPLKQKIKVNKSVYLVISKKFNDFKIPDFRGKQFKEIEQEIANAGIRSKVFYVENNSKENQCVGQFPAPGKTLNNKNEKVLLYLSTGNKKPIIFPNFKGLDLKEVLNFLSLNNLKSSVFVTHFAQYNPNIEYTIIDQRPLAGTIIQLNEKLNVQLYVQQI